MPKFFITTEDMQGSYIVLTHDVHHIVNVLRKSVGDEITVCDGKGTDYDCRILEISQGDDRLVLQIIDQRRSGSEPGVSVTLYQSLPKGDKMELVIQKGIETGLSAITPYFSERSLIHLDQKKQTAKVERWNAIAEAAAKQSGRGLIPPVNEIHTFKQTVAEVSKYDLALICYENSQDVKLKDVLTKAEKDLGKVPEKVAIWIGPEGGFASAEVEMLKAAGCIPVGLGDRILRTETAGMVASCLILYHYNEL